MRKSSRKRGSTTVDSRKSKKVSHVVVVSSDEESIEEIEDEENNVSEPENVSSGIDTSKKKKNGRSDDDASYEAQSGESETSSSSDSDDEALTKIAKNSKTSTSERPKPRKRPNPTTTPKKPSNDQPPVTDEMIKEKELEVKAIISHKRLGKDSYHYDYRFQWKDPTKRDEWVPRRTALIYYPNLLRDYDAKRKKADEVEAILAFSEAFGQQRYLLKWKDTARGQTWMPQQKTINLCPDIYRKFLADEKKANEIEAILSRKRDHGQSRYLVKWKDRSKGETWELAKKIEKFGRESLTLFREQQEKAGSEKPKEEVDVIVSHRKLKKLRSYLVKWKDHSKEETWVTEYRLSRICPESITDYNESLKKAFLKANEVEAILEHKRAHCRSKYLIKWKDHSKGETWETAMKTKLVGQDVLDKFVEENPDCAPEENRPRYRQPKKRKNKRKNRPTAQRRTREIPDRWEDSDTDMESHYIKVEEARKDIATMSDDDDESDSDDDSSDTDESVEVKRKVAVKKARGNRRAPKRRRPDSDDDSSDTDESVEVKRKVAVKKVKGNRRAPKRRRPDSDDDSSDTDESVEVKRKVAVKKVKGNRRAPKPSQRTKKSGTKRK